MFELIIFDFDDTMVRLDVRWADVRRDILQHFKIAKGPAREQDIDKLRKLLIR